MISEKILFKNPNRPVLIGKSKGNKQLISHMHFHPELELLYIDSGKFECKIENNHSIIASQGDIIFINTNVPHSTFYIEDNSANTLIQFKNPTVFGGPLRYLSNYFRQVPIPAYLFTKEDPDYEEIKGRICDILKKNENKDSAYDYYITANIYMFLALLRKKNFLIAEENIVNPNLISKILPALEYIENNYNENISLDLFASKFHMNRDYFCRLFKKACGTTLTDYLNFVRICKAEELLKTDISILEISYKVGFSSLSYFNRTFKKYKLCSPSTYRKIYKQSENIHTN